MKKQILFVLILMVAVVFFNSCEKEALEAPATTNTETQVTETNATAANLPKDSLKDNPAMKIAAAQIERIDTTTIDFNSLTESRSGIQLIQEITVTMSQGFWYLKGFNRYDLSSGYRYIAKVIPYHGDPDLYVHGRQADGDWRTIRSSKGPGSSVEEVSATLGDLYSTEDRLYFNVYATTYTQFKIQIYREAICTAGCLAGNYYIKSALGTYLDVLWNNPASGTNVWAYNFTGTTAQKWTLIHAGNNYYYIKSALGTYLDVQWNNPASGTNVWAYSFTGTTAQKWYVYQSGDGYVYIGSALGTFLDVYGGIPASGTNVWAYRFNGTAAQKWSLIRR